MVKHAETASSKRAGQALRLLAKVRRRQLELAIQGRVLESSRYAQRARTIRNKACSAPPLA